MKAFEEYQKEREIKTIGYLSNLGAFEAGARKGWRAALRWILACNDDNDCRNLLIPSEIVEMIEEELKQ